MAKQRSNPALLSHGHPIGVRYLGDGSAWVPGVPARDLLPEEWLALTEAQRQQCLATNLYELTGAVAPEEA